MEILKTVGAFVALSGSVFMLLAAIGVLRMPDLYTRIQAGTKASTLGTILMLLGLGMIHNDWMLKMILLIIFVAISNPVSSHVLARAAHHNKEPYDPKTYLEPIPDKKTNDETINETSL